jgi:hypothetical protein
MPRKRYKPEEIVAKLRQVLAAPLQHDPTARIASLQTSST